VTPARDPGVTAVPGRGRVDRVTSSEGVAEELPFHPVELGEGVVAGFTARDGGVSSGPWEGLDLGLHVGDDPQDVATNRRLLAARLGAPVVFARQVHGTRTAVLPRDGGPVPDAFSGDLGELDGGYDAMVTVGAGTGLGVLVADCVPVLLADAGAGVVATAHAGRPGLLGGVLTSVLAAMVAAGARPDRVRAALGPCAGGCCYEVPQQMQDDACAVLPAVRARTTWGTPSLDLRAGCTEVLRAAGVEHVETVGGCTIEDPALYSYRRARVTGRFAGTVVMVP
jgi:purine-nucleoside/S-methyl-5'-thioadenosine phosphorylase / adenosine deaminase